MNIEVYEDGNVKGKVCCPKCGKAMVLKVYTMVAAHTSNFWWEKEQCWYPNKRSKVNGEHRSEPYKSVLYCTKCSINICVWRKDVEFSIMAIQSCNQEFIDDQKKLGAPPEEVVAMEAHLLEPNQADVFIEKKKADNKLGRLVCHGIGPVNIVQLEGPMPDWPETVANDCQDSVM